MKANKTSGKITIGVFSSSSPVSATVPVRYERGIAYLKSRGYEIVNGSLYRKQDSYRSGTIQERAQEFNQLLYNEKVHILMASIAGKNTVFLLVVYVKTGLVTFYGPAAASSFGELPPFVDWTFKYFESMIKSEIICPYDYQMPEFWTDEVIKWDEQNRSKEQYKNDWICVKPGVCQGRLIGGNLNTMEGFFGTEYMPEIKKGDILFIEDSLKDACTIERSFSLLKLAGVLDRVSGIILGKHEKFDDNGTGRKPYEILQEVLGETEIPILTEFDCCHTHPMFTLPIGCQVKLDAEKKRVSLLESPLE